MARPHPLAVLVDFDESGSAMTLAILRWSLHSDSRTAPELSADVDRISVQCHERSFGGQAAASGLPRAADVVRGCWQVSEGPQAHFDGLVRISLSDGMCGSI